MFKKDIENRVNNYKDTLVLFCLEMVKLKSFGEDEFDFYYVYETLTDGEFESSAVLDFIPLIEFLPENEYESIQNMWDLNYQKVKKEKSINEELKLIKQDIVLIKNKLSI